MALFCKKHMTPLQRGSLRWMGVALLLTVCANLLTVGMPGVVSRAWPFLSVLSVSPANNSAWRMMAAAVVMVFPVLLAVFVGARYLAREPDEFIRALLMRALLWGIAWTLAADAVFGVLMAASGHSLPIALLNGDVLFVATGFSFRMTAWKYSR